MSQVGISINLNNGLYCWKAGFLLVVTAKSVSLCAIQTVEPMQSLHDYCSYLSIELLWVWLRTTGWHRLAHSFPSPWLSSANSVPAGRITWDTILRLRDHFFISLHFVPSKMSFSPIFILFLLHSYWLAVHLCFPQVSHVLPSRNFYLLIKCPVRYTN